LADGGPITALHLDADGMTAPTPVPEAARRAAEPDEEVRRLERELQHRRDQVERTRIEEALKRCGGNQTRAAVELGISRGTLITRMIALDMPRPRTRRP